MNGSEYTCQRKLKELLIMLQIRKSLAVIKKKHQEWNKSFALLSSYFHPCLHCWLFSSFQHLSVLNILLHKTWQKVGYQYLKAVRFFKDSCSFWKVHHDAKYRCTWIILYCQKQTHLVCPHTHTLKQNCVNSFKAPQRPGSSPRI